MLVVVLLCVGCGSTTVITGTGGGQGGGAAGGVSGGGLGGGGLGGGLSGTGGGGDSSGCSDDAKTVYVVADDRTFSAFDPRSKTFRDIGLLNCPATAGATPFSMSVARDAFAYVLYDSGELFKVSTTNLACTKTTFQPDATYRTFGMGFSTDAPGATTETLFIAQRKMMGMSSVLGRLDVASFAPATGPDIIGWPELTGTGSGELWGFFPGETADPFVARLDKTTGAFTANFPVPGLNGIPRSWAFAFWGGSFWIFYQRQLDLSTTVWEMKANTGAASAVLTANGRVIVGAGVSTCAPITIN